MSQLPTPGKFSLNSWRRNAPIIILIFAINLIWFLFTFIFGRADSNTDNCYKLVEFYKDAYYKNQATLDEYTRALFYKDAQIKNRELTIDSLRHNNSIIQP